LRRLTLPPPLPLPRHPDAQAEQQPGDPDADVPVRSTLLINLGNAHYEHSILRAAGGLDWKPLVRTAVERFEEAGEKAQREQGGGGGAVPVLCPVLAVEGGHMNYMSDPCVLACCIFLPSRGRRHPCLARAAPAGRPTARA
jgi:hypothetical protein